MKPYVTVLFVWLCSFGGAQVNSNTAPTNVSNTKQVEVQKELEQEGVPAKANESSKLRKVSTDEDLSPKIVKSNALNANRELVKENFTTVRSEASHQSTSRSPSVNQQMQMNEVVADYAKNAPNSFEYHYFKYVSGNHNTEWVEHLKMAQQLKPKNLDVAVQLAAYHYITEDQKALKQELDQLFKAGKIERELLIYGEHLLSSVPQGAVLISHGFDDTYSALYVQEILSKRSDVTLISLDFIQSQTYRKNLVRKGFQLPKQLTVDVDYLAEFCRLNERKQLYLSMTIPKPYLQPLVKHLSVIGLAFKYGEELQMSYGYSKREDDHSRNAQLWEAWSKNEVVYRYTQEEVKRLTSNYLPLLYALKAGYQARGDTEKLAGVDQAIEQITIQSKRYQKSYK